MTSRATSPLTKLERRRELLLFATIVLLAVVLRVGWPTLTEFKFSEARLEALALEFTQEGRLPLVGVPSSAGFDHSPISVYLYIPPFLLTANPIPATIYGGLVSAAAVVLCWYLARRWPGGGAEAALIAALLLAVGPWSAAFGRKIWQVVFVPFLALVFIGLMISALVEGRRWRLAWALLAYTLLVQVHPSALSLAPAIVLWLVIFWRQVRLPALLVGAGLGLLTCIPFIVHQFQHDWPVLTALGALPEARWDLDAVRLTWQVVTGQGIQALAGSAYPLLTIVPQLAWIFNLLGWLTVGATLLLAWRLLLGWRATNAEEQNQARVDLLLLSWFIVPVVFNLRHSLDLHWHFFALIAPAAFLIVGRALGTILRSCKMALVQIATLAGIGLLVLAQLIVLLLMGSFVATHDTSGGFGRPLSRYLAVAEQAVASSIEEDVAEVLVVGQGDFVVVDETPAIFDVLLRERVDYRFVDGQSVALFPPHRALALLTPRAGNATEWYRSWPAVDLQDEYQLVVLDGSWPQDDFAPVISPRTFQNGVELQGYVWQSEAMPDDQTRIWLLWQVLWQSLDDTHFSVRLLDSEGQQYGQQDSVGYPTAYRRKGDRAVSRFDISMPPEAESRSYWAQIGLYLYPQMTNLPVIDGAGNPVTDVIVIGPLGERP